MRGRAAPPHPGIYRVPPPPGVCRWHSYSFLTLSSKKYLLSNLVTVWKWWSHFSFISYRSTNMNYFIYFTWFHCTGRYELNKWTLLPMCGFMAQLVEHRTGIAEIMGSNPVEALIFSGFILSNCLNWKIYCDDHTSLSSTTAVQIWIISYIFHISHSMWIIFATHKITFNWRKPENSSLLR